MKKLNTLLFFTLILISASAQEIKKNRGKENVPVAIVITPDLFSSKNINIPLYSAQVLQALNQAQDVNFVQAEPEDKPQAIISIDITNFNVGARAEKINSKNITVHQPIGTDANGRTTYRAMSMVHEEVVVTRSAYATIDASIQLHGDASPAFEKKFNPTYNYTRTTNGVVGDRNVVTTKQSLSPKPKPEPKTEEFLLLLSNKEMLGNLSNELRKLYSNKQTARLN